MATPSKSRATRNSRQAQSFTSLSEHAYLDFRNNPGIYLFQLLLCVVNTATASSSEEIKIVPKKDEISCHASQNAEKPSLRAPLRKAYYSPRLFERVMTPSRLRWFPCIHLPGLSVGGLQAFRQERMKYRLETSILYTWRSVSSNEGSFPTGSSFSGDRRR